MIVPPKRQQKDYERTGDGLRKLYRRNTFFRIKVTAIHSPHQPKGEVRGA